MADIITAPHANHRFARVLTEVASGKEFIITHNGIPIARISPERAAERHRKLTPRQELALADSLAWLRRGWNLGVGQLDRDGLYDDARDMGTSRPDQA